MDELLNPPGSDEPAASMVKDSARLVLGLALMAAGVAIVLGGFVLRFGNKSGRLATFPFAGGLTILVGLGVMGGGVALAGRSGSGRSCSWPGSSCSRSG